MYVSRVVFFFNDTATTEIYTLSLHDALPISRPGACRTSGTCRRPRSCTRTSTTGTSCRPGWGTGGTRSTRGSGRSEEHTSELRHANISYAVFCLKKKKTHGHALLQFGILFSI